MILVLSKLVKTCSRLREHIWPGGSNCGCSCSCNWTSSLIFNTEWWCNWWCHNVDWNQWPNWIEIMPLLSGLICSGIQGTYCFLHFFSNNIWFNFYFLYLSYLYHCFFWRLPFSWPMLLKKSRVVHQPFGKNYKSCNFNGVYSSPQTSLFDISPILYL